MNDTYQVISTSNASATVDDISLDSAETEADALSRRILRPILIENARDRDASVKATLLHQRRATRKLPWKDADAYHLGTLPAGQEVRLPLSSDQTHRLYVALRDLYELSADGVPRGEHTFRVVDSDSAVVMGGKLGEIINSFLSSYGDDQVIEALEQLQPDLLQTISVKQLYEARVKAVDEFRDELVWGSWTENDWQKFFEREPWLLGQGLVIQFLSNITAQPAFGGMTVHRTGSQRGDMLMATEAAQRFAVLVDLKRPDSHLVENSLYRNKVHNIGHELVGGITQLQSNCRTWVIDGSRQEENAAELAAHGISTFEPRGILVIGHTDQLDSPAKRSTFELFRRNTHNPEIVTYDELLARAEFFIARQAPNVMPTDAS